MCCYSNIIAHFANVRQNMFCDTDYIISLLHATVIDDNVRQPYYNNTE